MYSKTIKSIYGGGGALTLHDNPRKESVQNAIKLFGSELRHEFPTAVGIEVEIEQATRFGSVDEAYWRTIPDTSLRNDGVELVSAPLQQRQIFEALANLQKFYEANPRSEFSHRCSIHVHVDVQKMTYEQLLVMIGFYLTAEGIFFDSFFPDRKGNNYCFPLTSVQLTQKDIQKRALRREVWKYAAVNLYHLTDFGTLEFRQHPGTKNINDLLAWIKTIHNIVTYAQRTPLKEFLTTLNELNTTSGYTEYVRAVLPDWAHPIEPGNIYDSVTAAKYFLHQKGD